MLCAQFDQHVLLHVVLWSCIVFASVGVSFMKLVYLLVAGPLKHALVAECHSWKQLFGRNVNTKYRVLMEDILDFVEDCGKRVARPIKDLDDIRTAMGALKDLREREIGIDRNLGPVEASFISYELKVAFICAAELVFCTASFVSLEKLFHQSTLFSMHFELKFWLFKPATALFIFICNICTEFIFSALAEQQGMANHRILHASL